MILYIENPKDSTPKLPELINKFSKVEGYKTNIQKSVAFLYTSNETLEKEYKNTIPFKIAPHKSIYHIFLIQSSINGQLGCFHVLTIVNSAIMNMWAHLSF